MSRTPGLNFEVQHWLGTKVSLSGWTSASGRLEERKILVSECANVVWKLAVVKPEVRVGEVVQSGVQRPAS